MRVFLKCKNCGYENSCATEATSRVEFAMQEGEYKKITCKNCNYSHLLLCKAISPSIRYFYLSYHFCNNILHYFGWNIAPYNCF